MVSFTKHIQFRQCVTQYGSPAVSTPTPVTQKGLGAEHEAFLSRCVPLLACLFFACVFVCSPRQVSTLGVAEEDEAPDTGGAADDQAHGQHGAVRHLPAQPAHKEEAQDDLHPAQAVHQAVAQLAEAEVALRQRCHHGLGIFRKMLARSIS